MLQTKFLSILFALRSAEPKKVATTSLRLTVEPWARPPRRFYHSFSLNWMKSAVLGLALKNGFTNLNAMSSLTFRKVNCLYAPS